MKSLVFGLVLLLHSVIALLNFLCVSAVVIYIFPVLDVLLLVSCLTSVRLTWAQQTV